MEVNATTEKTNGLAHRFDAFEIELKYVEALIDMLYQLPRNHDFVMRL